MTFHASGYQRCMFAIIAAVLFAFAFIFDVTKTSVGDITANTLMLAGLLCLALHLAGVGRAGRWRGSRCRRQGTQAPVGHPASRRCGDSSTEIYNDEYHCMIKYLNVFRITPSARGGRQPRSPPLPRWHHLAKGTRDGPTTERQRAA